jgi:hypothetical protein
MRAGKRVFFCWEGPPYRAQDFATANDFAERYGELPWIAFGGHHSGEPFDCRLLLKLPAVQTLTLHCYRLSHYEVVRELQNLRTFRLSSYFSDTADILRGTHLDKVHMLEIGETKKNNIDLAPIASLQSLTQVRVEGQRKHIEAIGDLKSLSNLQLARLPKTVSLGFVNRVAQLEKLSVFLGGRTDVDEVENPHLRALSINRVLGLERLNLHSLPRLETLFVEAEKQLKALDFPSSLTHLKTIRLLTLKGLQTITGIGTLRQLQNLMIYDTKVDFRSFCAAGLPESLNRFGFLTGKVADDSKIKAELDGKGYKPLLPGSLAFRDAF